jgi:hypothetical protein
MPREAVVSTKTGHCGRLMRGREHCGPAERFIAEHALANSIEPDRASTLSHYGDDQLYSGDLCTGTAKTNEQSKTGLRANVYYSQLHVPSKAQIRIRDD